MAKPTKETLRHKEAFEFYYGLGRERSLDGVRKKFGVSQIAAENWSRAFRWRERVAERDTKIGEKIAERNTEDIAKVRYLQLNIVRLSLSKAIEQLKANDTQISVSEVVKLLEHEMRLLGDRNFLREGRGDGDSTNIIQVIQNTILALPEKDRDEVRERLRQTADFMRLKERQIEND